MESTAVPPDGNNTRKRKSDEGDRLARITQGINKNGMWKDKNVRIFMGGRIYEFFKENEISTTKLATFFKEEYKMGRGAEDMAHSVVDSLLKGKGAGNRKRQALCSLQRAVQDQLQAHQSQSECGHLL